MIGPMSVMPGLPSSSQLFVAFGPGVRGGSLVNRNRLNNFANGVRLNNWRHDMSQLTEDLIAEWAGSPASITGYMHDHADEIQDAINGCINALLWATSAYADVADDGTITENLESDASFEDLNFDRDDFDHDSLVSLSREVIDFIGGNWADCLSYSRKRRYASGDGSVWTHLGHDLALTREGHGVGFWDRGLGVLGDRLTAACKPYGEFSLYLGDDGKVYLQ